MVNLNCKCERLTYRHLRIRPNYNIQYTCEGGSTHTYNIDTYSSKSMICVNEEERRGVENFKRTVKSLL